MQRIRHIEIAAAIDSNTLRLWEIDAVDRGRYPAEVSSLRLQRYSRITHNGERSACQCCPENPLDLTEPETARRISDMAFANDQINPYAVVHHRISPVVGGG
jgi:hypothetical protein